MQQLTLVGHIGDDAVVKDLGSTQVINFSLAVTEKVKDQKVTTWYKCAYFINNVAIAPWLTKGSLIGVTGRPDIETYEGSDGKTRANLKCFVNGIKLYSSTKAKTEPTQQAPAPTQTAPALPHNTNSATQEDPDDLPF